MCLLCDSELGTIDSEQRWRQRELRGCGALLTSEGGLTVDNKWRTKLRGLRSRSTHARPRWRRAAACTLLQQTHTMGQSMGWSTRHLGAAPTVPYCSAFRIMIRNRYDFIERLELVETRDEKSEVTAAEQEMQTAAEGLHESLRGRDRGLCLLEHIIQKIQATPSALLPAATRTPFGNRNPRRPHVASWSRSDSDPQDWTAKQKKNESGWYEESSSKQRVFQERQFPAIGSTGDALLSSVTRGVPGRVEVLLRFDGRAYPTLPYPPEVSTSIVQMRR